MAAQKNLPDGRLSQGPYLMGEFFPLAASTPIPAGEVVLIEMFNEADPPGVLSSVAIAQFKWDNGLNNDGLICQGGRIDTSNKPVAAVFNPTGAPINVPDSAVFVFLYKIRP